MRRAAERLTCQLFNYGEWGHEVQFHLDGVLLMCRGFETRESAIAWADQEQLARTERGWTDDHVAEWPTHCSERQRRAVDGLSDTLHRSGTRRPFAGR